VTAASVLGPGDNVHEAHRPQTETDFATTHDCAFWAALQAG
jgi:hypothetical protein